MEKSRIDFNIESVKEEVINTSIIVASTVGILSFAVSIVSRWFNTGFNISLTTEGISIILLILIALSRKRLSLSFKVYTLLVLIFFLTLSDSLFYGIFGGSRIYLALVPVFSLVYFSVRRSLFISLLAIAAFLFIGYLHHTGFVSLPRGYEPAEHVLRYYPWINNAIHISLLGLIIFYITRKFFNAFTIALEDLKERNKKISDSERNYREIFNSTNESIFLHDNKTARILDANDAALRMFGFDHKEEIINSPVTKVSALTDLHIEAKAMQLISKAITLGPQVFEWKSKRKNGEEFYTEISLRHTNIGGTGKTLAVLRDITDRKQAEEALRLSEEKLSTIFRLTPVAIAIADVENEYRITDINEAFTKTTGYQYKELIGHTHQEKMLWVSNEEYEKATTIFREKGRLYDFEFHFRRKDGEIRNGRISTEPAIIAGRKSLVTATVDTTLQKKAEKQLIAAREVSEIKGANLRSIIENTTDSIWAFDRDYKIIYTNKIFRDSFNASFGVQLFPGTNLLESLPDSIRPAWKKRYDLALANNR
ncbi:MAG: PAS domain S-box protein, partial [Bacteroidota bacterium]